jgi:phosphate transport system substrate-binding protein
MKNLKKRLYILIALTVLVGLVFIPTVQAEEVLLYSSSAQVRDAFGYEMMAAFTRDTGVKVDLYTGSSDAAVNRLMNGYSDIASTVEELGYRHQEYGYKQIPFCTAPLVVITNVQTPIRSITEEQLRKIFSGDILNWRELGGPDKPIIVIVPGKNTAAFKNFSMLALKRHDIRYDFMSYQSTMVSRIVKKVPWSISFITRGANTSDEAIKILDINGISSSDKNYPYSQTFSFVTKGEPQGAAKKLIDFTFSSKGQKIMKEFGMKPLSR